MPAFTALEDEGLRVASASATAINPYHLTGWKQTGNVNLVAVCDPAADGAGSQAAHRRAVRPGSPRQPRNLRTDGSLLSGS